MTERKLTQKRELFAQGIVEGLTAADAYRRAYSVDRMKLATIQREALKVAANPMVSTRIEDLQEQLRRESMWTAVKVVDRLSEIVDRCMVAKPVLSALGVPTGEWVFDSRGALKGLELIGKHIGMWPQKPPEINVSFPIQVQENISRLRSMSIDELRALAAVPVIEFPSDDDE